jgi:pantoate--beta-alanine ligase
VILFKRAALVSEFSKKLTACLKMIGFVPTMGALHQGHLSLVRQAKSENDIVICSIFVNPAQFNDKNDLEKYPHPLENDLQLLISSHCDILFLPTTDELYPDGLDHLRHFDLGFLGNSLEGSSRPGHFQGVVNVVDRFLEILKPDKLYLGQKDFQQVKVIEKLFQITNQPSKIIICPIQREESGLAMSSRNVRLTAEQRENASIIYKTLSFVKNQFKESSLKSLQVHAISMINQAPETAVDYLEFCDAKSFQIIHNWNEAEHIVCVTAVKVGEVRLLDNILLN